MATRVAIVTGGNKGLGLGIARGISKQFDGDVILTSRDADNGVAAVKQLEGEGLKAKYHQLDISSHQSITTLKEHIEKNYGGIDVLVNNAGMAFKRAATEPFAEQARITVNTNFTGTLNITKALLPLMRPHSRIVMVSSRVGRLGIVKPHLQEQFNSPSLTEDKLVTLMDQFVQAAAAGNHNDKGWPSSAYGTSKVGMTALTKVIARQVSTKDDILVNACCPGWVKTDMAGSNAPLSPDEGAETPIFLTTLPAGSPTGEFWYKKQVIPWDTPFS